MFEDFYWLWDIISARHPVKNTAYLPSLHFTAASISLKLGNRKCWSRNLYKLVL